MTGGHFITGEKVCEGEKELTGAYKKGRLKGGKEAPALFEEADGVHIKLRGKGRKKGKRDKAETRIGIAYDGWGRTGANRYALGNKVVVAGFSKAEGPQECREAAIAQEFSLDEARQRVLNADGAPWIKKAKDKSACFQLEPSHRNKAVKEKTHEEAARDAMSGLLGKEGIEEASRHLEIHRDSLGGGEEVKGVEEVIRYYGDNREGLLPCQPQGP